MHLHSRSRLLFFRTPVRTSNLIGSLFREHMYGTSGICNELFISTTFVLDPR